MHRISLLIYACSILINSCTYQTVQANYCLCYQERINGKETPVTSCSKTLDGCETLRAKVTLKGSQVIVKGSLIQACTAIYDRGSLGEQFSWQRSKEQDGF